MLTSGEKHLRQKDNKLEGEGRGGGGTESGPGREKQEGARNGHDNGFVTLVYFRERNNGMELRGEQGADGTGYFFINT